MPADILLYAIVAAGLVLWLRRVIGTRSGSERTRPNPFTTPPPGQSPASQSQKPQEPGRVPGLATAAAPAGEAPNPLAVAVALPRDARYVLSAPGAEAVLTEIARQDRNFNLGYFLTGAQDAFVMIVEAFAAGNRELLKSLLAPDLYNAFDRAIAERESLGRTALTEIHAIRKVEITDIRLTDKTASITLRFVADESSVTRDAAGTVVEGNPDRVKETIDIWVLARNLRSKDPTWFLQATREEDSGAAPLPSA